MLAVYETIDLGFVSALSKAARPGSEAQTLNLLQGNCPIFFRDPIQDETIYVYHAFGLHALQLGPLLRNLASALRDDNSNDGEADQLTDTLESTGGTLVQPIVNTFSFERK